MGKIGWSGLCCPFCLFLFFLCDILSSHPVDLLTIESVNDIRFDWSFVFSSCWKRQGPSSVFTQIGGRLFKIEPQSNTRSRTLSKNSYYLQCCISLVNFGPISCLLPPRFPSSCRVLHHINKRWKRGSFSYCAPITTEPQLYSTYRD